MLGATWVTGVDANHSGQNFADKTDYSFECRFTEKSKFLIVLTAIY